MVNLTFPASLKGSAQEVRWLGTFCYISSGAALAVGELKSDYSELLPCYLHVPNQNLCCFDFNLVYLRDEHLPA